MTMNSDMISKLEEKFSTIQLNGEGYVWRNDVGEALKTLGFDVPGYQLRDLMEPFGDNDKVTVAQLKELYTSLMEEKSAHVHQWQKGIVKVDETSYQVQGIATHGADEIIHTIRIAEEVAFSNWINDELRDDPDLKHLLPVEKDNGDLYKKVQDGLIICKLINLAQPETIDERAINKNNLNTYSKLENLVLALTSCSAIGCNVVNIDADDISKGKPHLVLGIIWQIIRLGLFRGINLEQVPGMIKLSEEDEELRKLSPEQLLLRWVNYHLGNANIDIRMKNFTSDVIDSTIYTHLLNQIAPRDAGVSLAPLNEEGNVKRATAMLNEAAKIDCRAFVTPDDVVEGNYKLNLAFIANLFGKYPALPEPNDDEKKIDEEPLEERTFRNWMNSLGVEPHLYDVIKKGTVNWKRVVKYFRKLQGSFDQIQNCNYAVELGKQLKFSLVGIQGKDIFDGNRTLTLALVWQLMRAYSLAVLAQCTQNGILATDKEIIRWVNEKLSSAKKSTQIRSFQDSTIANSLAILDLIDAIKPGVINYDVVTKGRTEKEKHENAKYALTSGRKIGASLYALPEHITEVNSKMVMTVFACIMARDYMPNIHIDKENIEIQPLSKITS
uniref:Calponin-homology (CH) domain-containing protein n=1 Tax=Panagrolaimus sp. ES5 TaxID=591445 RepID=A0AC34F5W9_9BILA